MRRDRFLVADAINKVMGDSVLVRKTIPDHASWNTIVDLQASVLELMKNFVVSQGSTEREDFEELQSLSSVAMIGWVILRCKGGGDDWSYDPDNTIFRDVYEAYQTRTAKNAADNVYYYILCNEIIAAKILDGQEDNNEIR